MRIDPGGAAGGDPAGQQRDEGEQYGYEGEGDEIVRVDSVEKAGGEFCGHPCGGQAERHGDYGEQHSLADDEALDGCELRAERDADADFAGAAADGIAHDSIEADGGEHEADESEDAEERAGEARQKERVAEMLAAWFRR